MLINGWPRGIRRMITKNPTRTESFRSPPTEFRRMKNLWRSHLRTYAILVALVNGIATLYAADFQNLDFEMATITPAPPGYTPSDAYDPISAADALPYWTVLEDSTVCTAVWGAPVALDETSVALVNGNYYPSLQGVYSVQLYAYADAPPGLFHTASISQTGLVPAGTHSIQFLMESPPVAGGVVQANPAVTLNGTLINIFPVSTSGGVVTMAGDVSAFAGTRADLSIQCAGISGAPFNLMENIFELDAISFSSNTVPEPNTATIMSLACLLGLLARVRLCEKGA